MARNSAAHTRTRGGTAPGGVAGATVPQQLAFFIPLGLTIALINVTHSLFNAALARLPSPAVSLAAFAVAKNVLQILQSPATLARQTATSLVEDRTGLSAVRKFSFRVALLVAIGIGLFAYTPLSRWFLGIVLGLRGATLDAAVRIMKVFVLFPLAVTTRDVSQAVAIRLGRTPLVTASTLARIVVVTVLVFLAGRITVVQPDVLAGLMFLSAIVTEALVMAGGASFALGRYRRETGAAAEADGSSEAASPQTPRLDTRYIRRFFYPLVVTSLGRTLVRPIVNAGLARTVSPETAIAGFAVAWGLGFMIAGPLVMYHQVPLRFADPDSRTAMRRVRLTTVAAALGLSLIIASLSASGAAAFVFLRWIEAPIPVTEQAVKVLRVMSLLPLVMATRQYFWGMYMREHRTRRIGAGKVLNVSFLALTLLLLLVTQPVAPAVCGMIAILAGESAETTFLALSRMRAGR